MVVLLLAAALALIAGWFVPVVGVIAAAGFIAVFAPVGSRAPQRATVVLVLVLSVLAVLTFAPSLLNLGWGTARVVMSIAIGAVIAARLLIRTSRVPVLPAFRATDAIAPIAGSLVGLMIALPFVGSTPGGIVSGLLTSWDLWAHFAFFANTYEAGSSLWSTTDPSGAYGVGYPQLPFVLWASLQWLVQGSSDAFDREQLLLPYVTWIATTVAACATLLTWLAGDLAERIGLARSRFTAQLVASVAAGVVVVFGSLSTYASAGHANFLLGVTVIAVASYWALAPDHAPRDYGWLLIPGAGLCAIALWPPLVLGVAAAGVGIVVALWSWRRSVAIAYAALVGCAVVVAGWKYLGILLSSASVDSLSSGGASGGLATFSIPLAIVGPFLVIAGSAVIWVKRGWQLAVAVASTTIGMVPFTLYLMSSVDAAATPRLDSYFLLKVAGGLVVLATPIMIAFAAVVIAAGTEDLLERLGGRPSAWRTGLVACGAGGLAASYGLLASPTVPNGFPQAPGFAAYQQRIDLVSNDPQGPLILEAVQAARQDPDRTALFWDNNGVLMTSWLQALLRVRSNADVEVAEGLGFLPSGEPPVAEFNRLIRETPQEDFIIFWTKEEVFTPLAGTLEAIGTDRVIATQLHESLPKPASSN